MRRSVKTKVEHRLRVYSEMVYGHKALKPAPGTNNFNRTCMPYPFLGKVLASEADGDFELVVDGFYQTAYLSQGGIPLSSPVKALPAVGVDVR